MTIGPEPMTRMRVRSVRRGMVQAADCRLPATGCVRPEARRACRLLPAALSLSSPFNVVEKLPEEVIRIVRAWRCFGMILHREGGPLSVAEPLNGAVVQIQGRDVSRFWQRVRVDREAVVLRRDLDAAGVEELDRVIGTAVAELQLVGAAAHREPHHLVPEAYPEHRHVGLEQR